MQENIYLKALSMTQSMLTLAEENEWDALSTLDKKRSVLLERMALHKENKKETLEKKIQEDNLQKERHRRNEKKKNDSNNVHNKNANSDAIIILQKITAINKTIESLAETLREEHKQSLLKIQKGKRVKDVYAQ